MAAAPTLLEDSVRIEPEVVRILDRRVFPLRTEWVDCAEVEQVAVAIEQMVTQSCGPFFAAAGGMVLAAAAARPREALHAAAARLPATRATNNGIRLAVTALRDLHPAQVPQEAERLVAEVHERGRRLAAAGRSPVRRRRGASCTCSAIEPRASSPVASTPRSTSPRPRWSMPWPPTAACSARTSSRPITGRFGGSFTGPASTVPVDRSGPRRSVEPADGFGDRPFRGGRLC